MADLLAPGLYFGLDENVYHDDPALGSGSVRALALHPIYYWVESRLNPLYEKPPETDALLFGRALHKLVLEGLDPFKASYARAPDKSDFPKALITADEIRAALRGLGQKVSGNKPDLIERLKLADPSAEIWDEILAKFERDIAMSGLTKLSRKMYEEVIASAGFIATEPMAAAAFKGGRSEVSVFWERDGVRLKARIDYLRLGKGKSSPIGMSTDLKSFTNISGMPPERAVASSVANTRLDIQAAAYLDGMQTIPHFIQTGKVFGAGGVNPEWLETLGRVEEWQFWWAFFEKGMPIVMIRQCAPDVVAAARMEFLRAIQAYNEHMERFGTAWRFVDPMPEPLLTLADLPRWLGASA